MRKLKLIVFASACLAFIFSSCGKDRDTTNSNFNIVMTGGQVIPPPPAASAAVGRVEASYNYETKMLNLKIYWFNLGSAVTAIHIHGFADPGAPAAVVQNIAGFSTATSSTFSGSVLVDEVHIKQAALIAGKYYIDIHTTTPPFDALGEIRGQLTFAQQ